MIPRLRISRPFPCSRRTLGNVFFLLAAAVLGAAFWMSTGAVIAAQMSPTQKLEAHLPAKMVLAKASNPQVLSAVCGAVKQWRADAPQIVSAAIQAHKKLDGAVTSTAINCLGGKPNCSIAAGITGSAMAANPDGASGIMDAAMQAAPDCRRQIEQAASGRAHESSDAESEGQFQSGPTNQNGAPASIGGGGGGGGFDPQQGRVAICHNGRTLFLPPQAAEQQLLHNPGDTAGACNPTPTTNP